MMELKSVGMMKFPTEWKVIIHSCSIIDYYIPLKTPLKTP
jgi:hypothetical protein